VPKRSSKHRVEIRDDPLLLGEFTMILQIAAIEASRPGSNEIEVAQHLSLCHLLHRLLVDDQIPARIGQKLEVNLTCHPELPGPQSLNVLATPQEPDRIWPKAVAEMHAGKEQRLLEITDHVGARFGKATDRTREAAVAAPELENASGRVSRQAARLVQVHEHPHVAQQVMTHAPMFPVDADAQLPFVQPESAESLREVGLPAQEQLLVIRRGEIVALIDVARQVIGVIANTP
jgi:hypothetical protein